ncbi:MAG: amidohydrolase [Lachnospiraceae bacterium]|nr:amidohydrolase [Lachnospiraceae bacterium]
MKKDLEFLERVIEEKSAMILDASDKIWEYAELAFHETKSADLLCAILEKEGFTLTRGDAGIPTCFTGTFSYGSGKPVMGLLGEYDALSALSQKAGKAAKDPELEGAPGHGCGHNALGTGSLAAALAVKEYLIENKKDGTVIYFGCPAEEGAGSKQFMARAGMFDNVDFVYTWHPATKNAIECNHSNAIMGANFEFRGVSAHAGGCPYLGRSALDAVELMNVGCNYLREHMIPEARIHYAYIDAGGTAPNVVQDHAIIRYEVRSPWVSQVKELFKRVQNVARGASIMTDTTVKCDLSMAFTEYLPNNALAAVADECLREVGAPKWDESDYALAKQFLNTYNDVTMETIKNQIIEIYGEDRLEEILERPLDSEVHPFNPDKIKLTAGSTDVGDVGYAAPTLNINVATACVGNVGHSWQMTAQSCSPIAHKGLLTAAKVMALSCVRTMDRPDVIEAAKKEVTKRNGGKYTCPLPDEVLPPLETY